MIHEHRSRMVLLGAFLALIGVSGCAQLDSEVGSSLVGDELTGELSDTLLPVTFSGQVVIGDVYKTSPASLPVGMQDGATSDIVLRFQEFDRIGDTLLAVHSGTLWLYAIGFVDSEAVTDWTEWSAEVLRIDESYNPLEYRYEDELAVTPIDTIPLGTAAADDSIAIELDSVTLHRWVEDTLAYGLRIRPIAPVGFLKRIVGAGSDPGKLPRLDLTVDFVAGEDTLLDSTVAVYNNLATFLIDDQFAGSELPRLYLAQGYARRMLFWADFSLFDPAKVSLNRVDLVLHADTSAEGVLGRLDSFTAFDLRGDWMTVGPDSAQFTSASNLAYPVPSDTSEVRVIITPLARVWTVQPDSNFGVGLRVLDEGERISRACFFDINADPEHRPMMHVIYTRFATP